MTESEQQIKVGESLPVHNHRHYKWLNKQIGKWKSEKEKKENAKTNIDNNNGKQQRI